MEICSKEKCTGCGACQFVCPKNCIAMKENEIGVIYPEVNSDVCIKCGRCKKVCPSLKEIEKHSPKRAYAAWSSDEEQRRTSASGGIAAELYNYSLENDMLVAGAKNNKDFSVSLELTQSKEQLESFKNSKYVFSTAYELYPQLKKALKDGKDVLVVGLPCQIAAVKCIFPKAETLFTAEVVCHGTTPHSYLKQHIEALEKEFSQKADKIYFRDPKIGTEKFVLSLYNEDFERFCERTSAAGDTYQIGYHRTITYRENCFNCRYAQTERIADITLSDYKGLGTKEEWKLSKDKVSSVLVNTDRGQKLIDELIKNNYITAYERPVNEPVDADPQLQHPSQKSEARLIFEKQIVKNRGDFEKSMQAVIRKVNFKSNIKKAVKKLIKH